MGSDTASHASTLPQPRLLCTLLAAALFAALTPALAWAQSGPQTDALPGGALQATGVQADEAEETPEERKARLRKEYEERRAKQEAEREARRLEVEKTYKEMEAAFLKNDFETTKEIYRKVRSSLSVLSREQKDAARYMDDQADLFPPKWWAGTKKEEKNSFKAEIWGRDFWANYIPSRELGVQMVYPEQEYNPRTGEWEITKLLIMVSWKPLMVDSPDPAKGKLSEIHGYKLGDIAEVIIWHELGHNYITENVSLKHNVELYTNYSQLYSTLHEYFADMTAIYHSTPRARRIMLQFRLDGLDYYMEDQQHCRASHAIGSLILCDMLENPDKWPSIHFPPNVPDQQVEVNTIIYVYEQMGTDWTAAEDMRLYELAKDYIMKQGEKTFKSKGMIKLPNGLEFSLMVGQDRKLQEQRDNWVHGKLDELIKSGRADDIKKVGKYDPPERDHKRQREYIQVFRNGELVEDESNPEPLRIEIPWEL